MFTLLNNFDMFDALVLCANAVGFVLLLWLWDSLREITK